MRQALSRSLLPAAARQQRKVRRRREQTASAAVQKRRRQAAAQPRAEQTLSAPVAQQLYEETAESLAAREQAMERNRYAREPALAIEQGRPTKRGRRDLDEARRGWDDRWSASVDDR